MATILLQRITTTNLPGRPAGGGPADPRGMTAPRQYHIVDEDGKPVPVDLDSIRDLVADVAADLAHHLRHTQREIDDCDEPALRLRLEALQELLRRAQAGLEDLR